MATKTPVKRASENAIETMRPAGRDIKNQVATGWSLHDAQLIYGGPEAAKSKEELDQLELQDEMFKNDAYAKKLAELGMLKNKPIQELTITPDKRKEIEEEFKSYKQFKTQTHQEAEQLGVTKQDDEEIKRKQKEKEEEEKRLAEEKEKQAQMENVIEAPGSTAKGPGAKKKNPAKTRRRPPPSAETRGSNNRE